MPMESLICWPSSLLTLKSVYGSPLPDLTGSSGFENQVQQSLLSTLVAKGLYPLPPLNLGNKTVLERVIKDFPSSYCAKPQLWILDKFGLESQSAQNLDQCSTRQGVVFLGDRLKFLKPALLPSVAWTWCTHKTVQVLVAVRQT
jgi:hypothetical protein